MKTLPNLQNLPETRSYFLWLVLILIFAVFFFVDEHDLFWSARDWNAVTEASVRVGEGSVARRIGLLFVGAFGMFSLFRRGRKPIRPTGLLGGLMLFFLGWAILSLAWTDNVALTSRRLTALAMICLGAIGIMETCSVDSIVKIVFLITCGYLFVGFTAEIVLGTLHPLESDYRFSGTLSPNNQGINCALLLLSALFLAENARCTLKALLLCIAAGAFMFLVLTKSRTTLAAVILALFAYWSLVISGPRKAWLVMGASIILCLLLLFFGDAVFRHLGEAVLLGRGNDPDSVYSLTGRVPLWEDCLTYVEKRPLLGYGYGGFWTPSRIDQMSLLHDWGIAVGHSAYLDLALGLGLLGAVTYISILLVGIGSSFTCYRITLNSAYAFLGVLLIFCALDGLMESAIVHPTFLEFLSIAALIYLGFNVHIHNRSTSKLTEGCDR